LFDAVSVRVHLNKDNKVAYIALPQWDPLQLLDRHKNMGIASIYGSACKNTQMLPKPHKTEVACVAAGNCQWVYDEDNATVNLKTSTDANKFPGVTRWTGTAADRMLFFGDGGIDATELEGKKLLKFLLDHIDHRTKFSDSRLTTIAADTKADWENVEYSRRRRLVEVAYYSFIGFNMLLMCCLLVGISFAYHVGTHEVNHEPIRW